MFFISSNPVIAYLQWVVASNGHFSGELRSARSISSNYVGVAKLCNEHLDGSAAALAERELLVGLVDEARGVLHRHCIGHVPTVTKHLLLGYIKKTMK